MKFGLEKESRSSSVKPTQYVKLEVSSSTEEPEEDSESCEDIVADPNVEESVARKSGRVRQRPDYYICGESVSCQKWTRGANYCHESTQKSAEGQMGRSYGNRNVLTTG